MSDKLFQSADLKAVRTAVADCVKRNGWLAVVGPVGAGKTTSTRAALAAMPGVRVVEPISLDRERTRIGHVLEACIDDLSEDERPRQSMEACSRQWRRLVGEASARERIVLLVEEAHRLHRSTLIAIKALREVGWAGRCPLVSVVLVGQVDLESRLRRVREVRLRVKRHTMQGLTQAEVGAYLKWLGVGVADAAAKQIALRAREPLAVEDLAARAREWADAHKHRQVTVEDVRTALGTDLNIGGRLRESGLTMTQVARRAGVSKSAVSAVAAGAYAGKPEVAEGIAAVLDEAEAEGKRRVG